jgi:hypothetical protein
VEPELDVNGETDDVPFAAVPTRGRGQIIELRGALLSKKQEQRRWNRILNTRTRPWAKDELMHIDGIPCPYRIIPAYGTVIYLPGGRAILLRDAWYKRKHIELPRVLRLDDIYTTPPNRRNEK